MKNIFVISLLLCLQLSLQGQKKGQARIDSLLQVLQSSPHDTTRVKTLNLLSFDLKLASKVFVFGRFTLLTFSDKHNSDDISDLTHQVFITGLLRYL